MTPLRQRMIEDMQLKGFSASTQEGYLNAVRQLAGYYRRSPDELSEEDLRQYFLYLTNVDIDDCDLRNQVLLRADPATAVDQLVSSTPSARQEAADRFESGRGSARAGRGSDSRLPCLSDHDLRLRVARKRRSAPAGGGWGQQPDVSAHPWQREQGSIRTAA